MFDKVLLPPPSAIKTTQLEFDWTQTTFHSVLPKFSSPVMKDCFAVRSSTSTSPSVRNSHRRPLPLPPDGDSAEEVVSSSTHPSPALDIHSRYNIVIQSNPHSERWTFHELPSPASLEDEAEHMQTLADVLCPNRDLVKKELLLAKDNNLNRLISNFFQCSEDTTSFLLDLNNSVKLARRRYRSVHAVLNDLPLDSLSQSQRDRAYDEFAQFHGYSNPFPSPDTNNFNEMHQCLSQLKNYLNRRIRKSNSKIRLICLATTHSALCTGRFCTAYIPPKKDSAQQNAAAKKLFVMEHELNSLDNLAKRLHNSVEDVRNSIRFGMDRGKDKHSIEEVLKQLRREQTIFLKHLDSLVKHICHCHGVVSSARCLLLAEVSSSITSY